MVRGAELSAQGWSSEEIAREVGMSPEGLRYGFAGDTCGTGTGMALMC